jgi:hypothetical protein
MCNGTSYTGDCSNGSQNAVTTFGIPAGCTATISAYFGTRCNGTYCSICGTSCGNTGGGSGCGASGLDGSDALRVGGNSTTPVYTFSQAISGSPSTTTLTNASGYTLTGTGSSNAGLLLQYAQTGGTMFAGLTANRSDEIVTYTMAIQSGCNCSAILPVDIVTFNAFKNNKKEIELFWLALNETNIQKYEISRSYDGRNFSKVGEVFPFPGNEAKKRYDFTDNSFYSSKVVYYKLTIINNENVEEKFYIKDVLLMLELDPVTYSQDEHLIYFTFHEISEASKEYFLAEPIGKIIKRFTPEKAGTYTFSKDGLSKGIYILFQNDASFMPQKILIH